MAAIRNSAKAVVVENGRVLTIRMRDADGDWYLLPGGGQRHGETLHQALRRECREEVGVRVEIGDLLFVREYIGRRHEFAAHDGGAHQVEFMFACRISGRARPKPGSSPDKGQLSVEWLPLRRIEEYRLYPLGMRAALRVAGRKHRRTYWGDVN